MLFQLSVFFSNMALASDDELESDGEYESLPASNGMMAADRQIEGESEHDDSQ